MNDAMRADKIDPEVCAQLFTKAAEELTPAGWTTDDWGAFWHRMTEECTMRLIVYKPEMVQRRTHA